MKKTISLFSLLFLFSVASSQANPFGRFTRKANVFGRFARQRANQTYDRVPDGTLDKANRAANLTFFGLITYSCGKMIFDITTKEKKQISGSATTVQEITQKPEPSESEFKKNVAELREYAIKSGLYTAEAYDSLEQRMKDHLWVQCLAEKMRAEKELGKEWSLSDCSVERTDLYPFEAGVAAKKRMLEETASAGAVVPVKIEVVSVNGRKPYSKEDDPFLNLVAKRQENINTFLAVSTTEKAEGQAQPAQSAAELTLPEPSDRFLVDRHRPDFAKEKSAFYQNLKNERKEQSARREALIRARQILESQ